MRALILSKKDRFECEFARVVHNVYIQCIACDHFRCVTLCVFPTRKYFMFYVLCLLCRIDSNMREFSGEQLRFLLSFFQTKTIIKKLYFFQNIGKY